MPFRAILTAPDSAWAPIPHPFLSERGVGARNSGTSPSSFAPPLALLFLLGLFGASACADKASGGALSDTDLTDTPDVADIDDETGDPPGDDPDGDAHANLLLPTLEAGDTQLLVSRNAEAGGFQLSLRHGDETRLRWAAHEIELGVVNETQERANYDPWPLVADDESGLFTPPPTLRWLKAATATRHDDTTVRLHFPDGERDDAFVATLSLASPGADRIVLTLSPRPGEGVNATAVYYRFAVTIDAAEGLYGLGEHFDHANHRGHKRAMQLEADGATESSYNEMHIPIPLLVGTTGWGLFVKSDLAQAWEVASTSPDRVRVTVGVGSTAHRDVPIHLYAAAHPLDITHRYYQDTGFPRLPAAWALGPWIWRDENDNQAQVESDIRHIRELDLAVTGYWIDRPYANCVNDFTWKASQFPDAPAMAQKIRDAGLKLAIWQAPYVAGRADPESARAGCTALDADFERRGFYPAKSGILLNKWGRAVDFTNPAAFTEWKRLLGAYTSMGVEGYKLDYAEDVVVGLLGVRNVWNFHDGTDERTMHREYVRLYHKVYSETLPESGFFLLVRGGSWGGQVYAPIVWPGDLDADFSRHRERVIGKDGKEYGAVGGLPAAVIAAISLGPSGYPFFASDTGGYRHSPPNKELFIRWTQHTALSSAMQVGNSSNTVPWEFDVTTGYDQENLDIFREFARLFLRMHPYRWSHAQRLASDGRPLVRAMALAYPGLGAHPDDQYMLGDGLLVAPVIVQGATRRDVIFPPGAWIDWFTGERVINPGPAGKTQAVDAPLAKLPLYLAAGQIVPLLRPTIDTLNPSTDPAVDSYATTPGVLWARTTPGPASTFILYDGTTLGQSTGEAPGSDTTLTATPGTTYTHGIVWELLWGAPPPEAVKAGDTTLSATSDRAAFDAATTGWWHDPITAGGILWVKAAPPATGGGAYPPLVITPSSR